MTTQYTPRISFLIGDPGINNEYHFAVSVLSASNISFGTGVSLANDPVFMSRNANWGTTNNYGAWCLDPTVTIVTDPRNGLGPAGTYEYGGYVYSSTELQAGLIHPDANVLPSFAHTPLLDGNNTYSELNWLVNQDFAGTSAVVNGVTTTLSWGDEQVALWKLMGYAPSTYASTSFTYNAANADYILGLAQANAGFIPDHTQYIAQIVDTIVTNSTIASVSHMALGTHSQPLLMAVLSAEIQGTAFADLNHDGILQGPTETNVSGITVNLLRDLNDDGTISTNEIVQTATTDSNGGFDFKGLTPGFHYEVQFIDNTGNYAGFTQLPAPGTTTGYDDFSVANPTTGLTTTYTPTAGQLIQHVDVGLIDFSSVSGSVLNDADYSGSFTNADNAIQIANAGDRAVVQLWNADTNTQVGADLVVNQDGTYSFDHLVAGNYYVVESRNPSGYTDVTDVDGNSNGGNKIGTFHLNGGENLTNQDFLEERRGSISGAVLADSDNSHGFSANDAAIVYNNPADRAVVQLWNADTNTQVGADQVVGEDGSYLFDNLAAGNYYVVEVKNPFDYSDVTDVDGNSNSANRIDNITLNPGDHIVNQDFLEEQIVHELAANAALSGYVYVDKNDDGIHQYNETPLEHVKVYLTGKDYLDRDVIRETETNSDGYYEFLGLQPGTYNVSETQPADYFDGQETQGNVTPIADSKTSDAINGIVLTEGQSSDNNNFGELSPTSISGYVFDDSKNDDGVLTTADYIQNGSDLVIPGIADVEVTLQGVDDLGNAVTRSTTTAADGSYSFDHLRPGTYQVFEGSVPSTYLDGGDAAGNVNGNTVGVAGNDEIHTITLNAGDNSVENNFGEIKPSSITGFVLLQTDESPLEHVKIILSGVDNHGNTITSVDENGNVVPYVVTYTNAEGYYEFTGLRPGTYNVAETQPQNLLDGDDIYGDVVPNDLSQNDQFNQIVLGAGVDDNLNIFLELPPASFSGYVYADQSNDGSFDASETPISSVVLTLLDQDGNEVLDANGDAITTTTDDNGFYEFTGLRPGTYGVRESQPASYLDGKDTAGTLGGDASVNDVISGITLNAGDNSLNNNFGELTPASFSGYVYADKSNDGSFDANESPISGVTLTLLDANGNEVLDANGDAITTTTDDNGFYEFTGLRPGTYGVRESQPASYLDGKDTAGTLGGDTSVNDVISGITLNAGDNSLNNNFGELKAAKLAGYVYHDKSNDGVFNNTEQAISSVTLTLLDANGNTVYKADGVTPVTTTTNSAGYYEFTNLLPGTYGVRETQPADYLDGKDTAGSLGGSTSINDVISGITLEAGDSSLENNFGELKSATLGDRLWIDANADGIQNTNGSGAYTEAGLGGIKVTLTGAGIDGQFGTADDTVTSQLTGANGDYLFTGLAPDQYQVNFDKAALSTLGYVFTGKDVGGNDAVDSDADTATGTTGVYTLASGDDIRTVDAGVYKAASLGNYVWYDKDADGKQDSNETGIANVKVNLIGAGADGQINTADDVTLTSTTTNSQGFYNFTGLTPGVAYQVQFDKSTLPAGYILTAQNVSANGFDTIDSDANLTSGKSQSVTLNSGEYNDTLDAGAYKIGIDIEKYVSGTQTTTTQNGCGSEGADSNYWKNNCTYQSSLGGNGWSNTGCKSSDTFNKVFGTNCTNGSKTLLQCLSYTGSDSQQILMRESVSAYLNACHTKVDYAYSKDEVCSQTKQAINSGNYTETCHSYTHENSLGCNFSDSKCNWSSVVDTTLYDADAPPGLDVKVGSVVTFTYIVKNTGDTALKNVTVTDDRIDTLTFVGGDTNGNGWLDISETWTYKATEVATSGTIKNTGTATGTDAVGGIANATDQDDAYYTGYGTNASKGSIGDRVWLDKNANGIQDSGETTGVSGVTVTLKGAGADGLFNTADDSTATTTTNASGLYQFNNLDAGKYTVSVGAGTGYVVTKQNQGSNDAVDSDVNSSGTTGTITLAAGEQKLTVDAGLYRVGIDVEKFVSSDTNTTTHNGCGEGADSTYWKNNCTYQSSLGSNGWSNTGCKSSDTFNQVFGTNCTNGGKTLLQCLSYTGSDSQQILMRESVSAYLNACHSKVDYAYNKDEVCAQTKYAINNSRYDETTKAFSHENSQGCNFSDSKTSWNSVVTTTLYDADAPPGLELKAGSTVEFTYIVKNTGDVALKNVSLTDDRIASVTLVSGDTNGNGWLDTSETWTYKAYETAAVGTIKNTGTATGVDAVGGVVKATDQDDAYYTGYTNSSNKGSIGDRVFEDANYNGVQDSGETGLSNIKVTLLGAGADNLFGTTDDINAITYTNSKGYYQFNDLDAGQYKVDVDVASGYFVTKQNQGSNDAKDSDIDSTGLTGVINLATGEQDLTVDAGLYRKASVGDKVWDDQNHNYVQDSGELGVGGVKVKLIAAGNDGIFRTADDVVVASVTTGQDKTATAGQYLISNVDPGSYQLQFDKTNVQHYNYGAWYNMNDWKWAPKNSGSNDSIDSDVTGDGVAKTNVTYTDTFTLTSGQNDMTKDAGITPIVIDLNGDGVKSVSLADSTGTFDLFGNGKAISSGWLSSDDGFLAVDNNGNGSIDNISELFGGANKGDGFAKLASFDSNGDGFVTADDEHFLDLRIWQDKNGDHKTDLGELFSLSDAGITSLKVNFDELPFLDNNGNVHLERSQATFADGKSADMTDLYFNVSTQDAADAGVSLTSFADLLQQANAVNVSLVGTPDQQLETVF